MIGIMNSNNSISGMDFDYRSAQAQLKAALAAEKKNETSSDASSSADKKPSSIKQLKAETSKFLTTYTNDMTELKKSAEAAAGSSLKKTLAGKPDSKPEDNVKAAVDKVQEMVDSYNKTLTDLSKNAERGTAVTRQIKRMSQAPVSEKSMALAGIKVNKDGTLALDKEKLTEALSGSETKREFTVGILDSVSQGVKRDATAGMNETPARIINNDLAQIQQKKTDESPFALMGMYSKSGSYNMMNMGVVGVLMNSFA